LVLLLLAIPNGYTEYKLSSFAIINFGNLELIKLTRRLSESDYRFHKSSFFPWIKSQNHPLNSKRCHS